MDDENENWARGERVVVLLDEVCRYWEMNEPQEPERRSIWMKIVHWPTV
jgi:hypothetical protein